MFEIIYLSFFVVLIGLCIGSFLNVVVLRSLSGESIVFPPSKCPKCEAELKWFDNIPLVSFLILGGKCRTCEEKISIQYPIVEFLTAVLFLIAFLYFGVNFATLFAWVISALGIVIATTDIKEKIVFDVHTVSFIVVALLFALATGHFKMAIIGLFVGALIVEGLARIGLAIINKRAFGEGDTYIAAGIGALVGAKLFLLIFVLSIFFQVLAILPAFLKRLWSSNQQKLAISLITFLVVTMIYKFAQMSFDLSLLIQLPLLIIIIALGIYLCRSLTLLNKENTQVSYIPFGPSLLIVTFFVAYWSQPILYFAKKFVS